MKVHSTGCLRCRTDASRELYRKCAVGVSGLEGNSFLIALLSAIITVEF